MLLKAWIDQVLLLLVWIQVRCGYTCHVEKKPQPLGGKNTSRKAGWLVATFPSSRIKL